MNDIDKFAKEGVYKILVGNKSDLEEQRKVPTIKGKQLADEYGIPFWRQVRKRMKISKNYLLILQGLSSINKPKLEMKVFHKKWDRVPLGLI